MAIFGKLKDLKKQIDNKTFQVAFEYLENIKGDISSIKEGDCIKEMITEDIFVLKQAYGTKNREDCFFESHKKYIDIQFMIKGDEFMDVTSLDNLQVLNEYDENTDFIKYEGKESAISNLLIKENELAIFYPTDAHQPCIKVDESQVIYKAVIKIPLERV
jgi:YhcH/YjgK/YiaL family protein